MTEEAKKKPLKLSLPSLVCQISSVHLRTAHRRKSLLTPWHLCDRAGLQHDFQSRKKGAKQINSEVDAHPQLHNNVLYHTTKRKLCRSTTTNWKAGGSILWLHQSAFQISLQNTNTLVKMYIKWSYQTSMFLGQIQKIEYCKSSFVVSQQHYDIIKQSKANILLSTKTNSIEFIVE